MLSLLGDHEWSYRIISGVCSGTTEQIRDPVNCRFTKRDSHKFWRRSRFGGIKVYLRKKPWFKNCITVFQICNFYCWDFRLSYVIHFLQSPLATEIIYTFPSYGIMTHKSNALPGFTQQSSNQFDGSAVSTWTLGTTFVLHTRHQVSLMKLHLRRRTVVLIVTLSMHER